MHRKTPRVSIGLPVYNGEKYLRNAIKSVLSQTYKDFELIISDNASTDKTQKICQEYAKKDKRIRYVRQETNVGAAENFNITFHLARGEYFKWVAHDDGMAPTFLKKCVEALDNDSTVVLAYPRTIVIDEKGKQKKKYREKWHTNQYPAHMRFCELMIRRNPCYQVFGLIRTSALSLTNLIDKFASSDQILLARLSLLGKFHEIPEYLFYYRHHPDQSIQLWQNRKTFAIWFDPELKGKIIFPRWRVWYEYLLAVHESWLDIKDKTYCYLQLMKYLIERKFLARDILIAFQDVIRMAIKPLTIIFYPKEDGIR
ncbi:glycosyltransferase family 2 protein [Nanoarchaeota archaeon]